MAFQRQNSRCGIIHFNFFFKFFLTSDIWVWTFLCLFYRHMAWVWKYKQSIKYKFSLVYLIFNNMTNTTNNSNNNSSSINNKTTYIIRSQVIIILKPNWSCYSDTMATVTGLVPMRKAHCDKKYIQRNGREQPNLNTQ